MCASDGMSRLLRHRSHHTVEMDTGKDWSEDMSTKIDMTEWAHFCESLNNWQLEIVNNECPGEYQAGDLL